MQIYRVTDVNVFAKPGSTELVVQATGLAATAGWTNPRLDGSGDPKPKDAVIELSFDADRPTGPVPQVLTPISASATIKPAHGADVVIVAGRTNSISVHVTQFSQPGPNAGPVTTLAVGEETPPTTLPSFEEQPTTFFHGEEMFPTTYRFGEEGPQPTTLRFGEENPTTFRFGEEGPGPTTLAFGEEGSWTDPRLDDPAGGDPFGGGGGSFGGGGNPFGGY
jgi:hypothetical protein